MLLRLKQLIMGAVLCVTFGFVIGTMAHADDGWKALSGEKLRDALVSRTLGFDDGASVGFFSDGRALRGMVWGRWWLEKGALCLDWPERPLRCYQVKKRGIDFEFKHHGRLRAGRYIDLN